jgi:hypothetical protein
VPIHFFHGVSQWSCVWADAIGRLQLHPFKISWAPARKSSSHPPPAHLSLSLSTTTIWFDLPLHLPASSHAMGCSLAWLSRGCVFSSQCVRQTLGSALCPEMLAVGSPLQCLFGNAAQSRPVHMSSTFAPGLFLHPSPSHSSSSAVCPQVSPLSCQASWATPW